MLAEMMLSEEEEEEEELEGERKVLMMVWM